jgi:hypothetical protein
MSGVHKRGIVLSGTHDLLASRTAALEKGLGELVLTQRRGAIGHLLGACWRGHRKGASGDGCGQDMIGDTTSSASKGRENGSDHGTWCG